MDWDLKIRSEPFMEPGKGIQQGNQAYLNPIDYLAIKNSANQQILEGHLKRIRTKTLPGIIGLIPMPDPTALLRWMPTAATGR